VRRHDGQLVYAAAALADFLDCEHLSGLDLLALLDPAAAPARTPWSR